MRRLDKLGQWMTQFEGRNYEGVMFTPVVTRYLAEHSDFDAALAEFDRLRTETLKGQFRARQRTSEGSGIPPVRPLERKSQWRTKGQRRAVRCLQGTAGAAASACQETVELSEQHLAQAKALRIPSCVFPAISQALQGQNVKTNRGGRE